MNRTTTARILERDVATPKSKTLKRRVFDDWTRGWKLHWSTTPGLAPYVSWENGSLSHLRSTPEVQRTLLRAVCLDEVDAALTKAGYTVARQTDRVVILERKARA